MGLREFESKGRTSRILALALPSLLAAILGTDVLAQGPTGSPAWVRERPPAETYASLPGFIARRPEKAPPPPRRTMGFIHVGNHLIRAASDSGILAVSERREGGAVRRGWDTGLTGVHSLVGSTTSRPKRLAPAMISGFDDKAGCSRIVEVSSSEDGFLRQKTIAESMPGELWYHATRIGSEIYIHDEKDQVLLRLVDQDGDGMPESRDTSFRVAVPQRRFDVHDEIAWNVNSVLGFSAAKGHVVEVWSSRGCVVTDSRAVYVDDTPRGFELVLGPKPTPTPTYDIRCDLIAGQRRIVVYGQEGDKVAVERDVGIGAVTPISSTHTFTVRGDATIDLLVPLEATWRVRLVSTKDLVSSTPTRWLTVSSGGDAVLFPKPSRTHRGFRQGSRLVLSGDLIRSTMEACYTDERITEPLVLKHRVVDETAISIILPMLTNPLFPPASRRERRATIFLRDRITGRKCSNALEIDVEYQ